MKKIGQGIVLTSLLLMANAVFAARGGDVSGGGQGIICRNNDGTVASAKLLDLVEAENYFLLTLQAQPSDRRYLDIAHDYASILDDSIPSASPTSKEAEQIGNLPPRISYDINDGILLSKANHYQLIRLGVDQVDAQKMLIPGDDFQIPPVGDSHPRVLPSRKGCNIEQIAVYTDGDGKVRFVGSIWNKLDNINKAALLIHESLYRELRSMGDTTSDRTRKTVAFLFSGMKFEWILGGVPQKYLSCWTNDANASFQFVVYPANQNFVTAQFLVYNGEAMLTKTAAYLNSAPFAKLLGMPVINPSNNLVVFNKTSNPLLDLPNFEFGIWTDDVTGSRTATIEAISLIGGKNPLQISCKSQLSKMTYGSDGSVSADSAQ